MSDRTHPPNEHRHVVPLDVDYSVTPTATGSLVSVTVTNETDTDLSVAVHNELPAPVSPPRTEGVPDDGWSREGFEGVVAAGETRSLGYACAAPPVEPPVSVELRGRPAEHSGPPNAEALIRELGSVGPPRDALPVPRESSQDASAPASDASTDTEMGAAAASEEGFDTSDTTAAASDCDSDVVTAAPDADGAASPTPGSTQSSGTDPVEAGVADVDRWLDRVESRVERGERLTGASVSTAADVVAEAGGVGPCCRLPERLDSDAEALRAVAARARRLAERAEATDVPADALRRLS